MTHGSFSGTFNLSEYSWDAEPAFSRGCSGWQWLGVSQLKAGRQGGRSPPEQCPAASSNPGSRTALLVQCLPRCNSAKWWQCASLHKCSRGKGSRQRQCASEKAEVQPFSWATIIYHQWIFVSSCNIGANLFWCSGLLKAWVHPVSGIQLIKKRDK